MRFSCSDYVSVFKALSDETRLRIVIKLCQKEMCAAALLKDFAITQPTLSHHMKLLCDADIVQGRKEGKWVHYSINQEGAERAKMLLEQQVSLDASSGQSQGCCDK